MNNLPTLTELEQDTLAELFNIGVGQAAASLSTMTQQEVLLSIPAVTLMSSKELSTKLIGVDHLCSIRQAMTGQVQGQSILLLPDSDSLEVVRCMLGGEVSSEILAEMQEEALTEIGNIVLNACIGSIANILELQFEVEAPVFQQRLSSESLSGQSPTGNDMALHLHIDLTLKESAVTGYMVFLMSSLSFNELSKGLRKMLGQ